MKVAVIIFLVIILFAWLGRKKPNNEETLEKEKQENKADEKRSSYNQQYNYNDDYNSEYPKVVKGRRKGDEGKLILIKRQGEKGQVIYGQRESDYVRPNSNYGRRSDD